MARELTNEILNEHKHNATEKLNTYLESLINSSDPNLTGKADKLCYWIEDWVRFLDFEPTFSPMSLRRYKRGEIIKVHLGFNIGSEEGGLHYAVVIDKNNAKTSPVVTVVPLTSVKPKTNINNLKKGSIYLGNELFTQLNTKISYTKRTLTENLVKLKKCIDNPNDSLSLQERIEIPKALNQIDAEIDTLNKMRQEILKIRSGSIALVNQITTISKIRIYDPKTDHDILSGIKLSNEKLDLIDTEIANNFTNINK